MKEKRNSASYNFVKGSALILNYLKINHYTISVSPNNKLMEKDQDQMRLIRGLEVVIKTILYPMLPLLGITFTIGYFIVGFYVYRYPNLENSILCRI